MQTKTRLQKPIPLGLVLVAVALLAACSAESPTAPPPSPTPSTYGISLVASSSQAEAPACIDFVATVTSGGHSVPDNTSVMFHAAGAAHFQNGTADIVLTTTAGKATARLCSDDTGAVLVTARVPNNKAELTVRFYQGVNPLTLAVYSIQPNEGTKAGGDRITIFGRGFALPVAVDFTVGGVRRNAQVVSVTATGDEIVLLTPPADFSGPSAPADVRVRVAVGADNEGSETVPAGFTYWATVPGGPPSIYSIAPPEGSWVGGEQVTITGVNFFTPIQVRFANELAEFVSVSADNRTVTVLTPRHTTTLNQPLTVDVTILTSVGTTGQREFTFPNGFTWRPDAGVLPILYSVQPNRGSPRGGETVTLTGRYLKNATVVFRLGAPLNVERQASVLSISADGTVLTLLTPQASPEPVTTDVSVAFVITTAVGSATFENVFTYVGESRPPLVYYLVPNRGSGRAGGELVTIYGKYFLPPMRVVFEGVGDAVVQTVATDGTSVTVLTPPVTGTVPTSPVSVTLTTQYGTGRDQFVTLANAFTYLEGEQPQLFSISPNSGPVEGGTRVTLVGRGFQYPAQVFFADHQAVVISVNYEQVICYSPSITPTQPSTPTTVDVTVKNQTTGQTSNALQFRYGEAMFISGISPNQGSMQGGTVFTIYGQGFVAPVQVVIQVGSGIQAEVLSVAGTEVVARTAPVPANARGCGAQAGEVKVTNLGSNLSAIGPIFTYLASNPMITAVYFDPPSMTTAPANYVQQYDPAGTCSTPYSNYALHITGSGFERRDATTQSAMTVRFGSMSAEIPTTYISDNEILVEHIPDLVALTGVNGERLNTVACIVGSQEGRVRVDTPFPLTVTNTVNTCTDTLQSAFVIRPCDSVTCRLVPAITSIGPVQGPIAGGTIVNIAGTNFTCPVTVRFGGALATVNSCAATLIQVTTPPQLVPGPVDVVVQSTGGDFATLSNGFTYTAAIDVSIQGPGQVAVAPGGGTCTTGTCLYNLTAPIATLTATATAPAIFGGWTGATCGCSGTSTPCTVDMTQVRSCTATFNPSLSVTKSGANAATGQVTVIPLPVDGAWSCAAGTSPCSDVFAYNAALTLTASSATATWTGDCADSTGGVGTVSMSVNRTCTVTFP